MAFTSVPTTTVTSNIPVDGVIEGCSGTVGELTFTATVVTNVTVGQRVFEQGTNDNLEFGVGARVTNVSGAGPYTITVDVPNRKTFAGVLAVSISDRGSITEVTVSESGDGYRTLPRVIVEEPEDNFDGVPSNDKVRAKIILFSDSIGKIKSINISKQGVNHEETPLLLTPISAITSNSSGTFRIGELVYDANFNYGTYPLTEEIIRTGPHAIVKYSDSSRNMFTFEAPTDKFTLTNEDDLVLTIENGYVLTNEIDDEFGYGTLATGFTSGSQAKFLWLNRANLTAVNGAMLNRDVAFADSNGFTSESIIKLHDGKRIQDFAYFIKTIPTMIDGISTSLGFNEYKDVLKKLAHPVGYSMYGETQIDAFGQVMANLYRKLDAQGLEAGYTTVISIVLQLINTYQEFDIDEQSTFDVRASKYRQLMILIERFMSVFTNIDLDDGAHRILKVVQEKYVYLGGMLDKPYMFHLYLMQHTDTFGGFTPARLEQFKYSMIEESGVFDAVTFSDFDSNVFDDTAMRKIVLLQPITII